MVKPSKITSFEPKRLQQVLKVNHVEKLRWCSMTDFYDEIFGNFSCPSPRQTLVPVLWVQFHALLTCDYKSELISIQIFVKSGLNGLNGATRLVVLLNTSGAPNDNFRKIICSENDLRSRIFGSFSVKFLACLLLLGFSTSKKNGIIAHF